MDRQLYYTTFVLNMVIATAMICSDTPIVVRKPHQRLVGISIPQEKNFLPCRNQQAEHMPPYTRRGQQQQQLPAEYSRDGEERLLTANWGSIAVVICALPWVALFALNPISFFFICFWMTVAWFVTLVPKLAYVLLLELAIMQQRGREFLDTEQKRIRAVFPPFSFTRRFVELTVMELGSWSGGMEVLKEFRGTAGPIEPNIFRLIQLPLTFFSEGKSHVRGFAQVLWHYFCRFLALNVVAKLYTRHQPGSQGQISSR